MTTPPVGISIARHATDAVKSWPPRVFTERNGGGVTRVVIFPVASTVSSSAERKRVTRRLAPSTMTSRRSESSCSVRVAAPPAAGRLTSWPSAHAT